MTENISSEVVSQIINGLKKTYAYIELDAEGNILDANDTYCDLLGYTPSELIGNHHRVTAPPEVANSDAYKKFLLDLKAGQSFLREAKRVNRKNGNIVYFTASYNPISDHEGRVYKIVILATDITVSKLNEEKISQISMMIEKSSSSILFVKPDGVLNYLNIASSKTLASLEKYLPHKIDQIINNKIYWISSDSNFIQKYISNPDFLPANLNTQIGPETLSLNISSILDDNNNYLGALINLEISTSKEKLISDLKNSAILLTNSAEAGLKLSTSLGSAIEEISSQSKESCQSSNVVNQSVKDLAKSMNEMSLSISEITKITNESSLITKNALQLAKDTESVMTNLSNSSKAIGNVIKVISTIAEQTNLLALNATIEAARAGDAGKGFGVVASEVKELAKQTAKATEDVSKTIIEIQSNTGQAILAIDQICKTFEKVNTYANNIQSGMEVQVATSKSMNQIVNNTEIVTTQINENLDEISKAIALTSKDTNQVRQTSIDLESISTELNKYVLDISKM